jgi:hypothetical protein
MNEEDEHDNVSNVMKANMMILISRLRNLLDEDNLKKYSQIEILIFICLINYLRQNHFDHLNVSFQLFEIKYFLNKFQFRDLTKRLNRCAQ